MAKEQMKILITEPEYFPEKSLKALESIGEITTKKLSRQELLKTIENFDIIIVRIETEIDREVINLAKKLKIIASVTTGVNHIDVDYAKEKNIKIINLEGANSNSAAEHTFALILSLVRNIPNSFESIKKSEWKRHEFIGHELKDKTLGIVGFGRIGSRIAVFAKSFGMNVLTYDKYVTKDFAKNIGASLVSLEELLKDSDIITLNCILTSETKAMISYKEFEKMKKFAFLVNTSRAEVVDEKALLDALKSGKIRGAALDVIEDEKMLRENKEGTNTLIEYAKNHKNLIITPHLGGLTHESINDATMFVVNKIKESLKS